jgi:hypothetical protein
MNKSLSESIIFKKIWMKHFKNDNPVYTFSDLKNISFLKIKNLPVFESVGNSSLMLTNSYSLDLNKNEAFKNKVFVVYNVPSHLNLNSSYASKQKEKLSVIIQKEYEGYMVDFSCYDSIESYFKKQLGGKKNGNIRRRQKKLEHCFNIRFELYHNSEMDKNLYLSLMAAFKLLLIKKFKAKKEFYLFTSDEIWRFYKELFYKMIIEGEASLFVVYNENKPISFYLSYHFESYVMGVIPVFDLDYSKFGLGSITIKKMFELLYKNGVKKYDFYKGDYGYKKEWTNMVYHYEHHIIHDKNMASKAMANVLAYKFKLKQYLREKKVNELYYKALFFLKGAKKNNKKSYKIMEVQEKDISKLNLEPLNYVDTIGSSIGRLINEYLFSNNELVYNIAIFKNTETSFVLKHQSKTILITR